ncbi:deoxyribonuclease HsdR [Candidatus Izimaplasma bacterium ZiA1]|uniref:type I restriction endonuclease subunit R n=1 Tax=Candidatus Izimoplasma sp. ZiA1 TaxID=2024899 RepID=UPI000BAA679C|nr:deoxyribonuclease HsdR [Candidatus Izimaplasma bacterium ZiA1]
MSIQTEKNIENNLIRDLTSNGYEYVVLDDKLGLEKNFKKQLEKHNEEKLQKCGVSSFSDSEFKRILHHLEGGTIFQKASRLRSELDFQLDNGELIYISFLNTEKWCKNQFQVTNQITYRGKYENRYDVTLLINGLPLVQIELKRKGIELKEAFNQICRYQRHSYSGLFNYIQIFVLSNGTTTKYFSNNKELNFKQTFYWSNIKNVKYALLSEFTTEFLEKCHVSKMISKYIVLNESTHSLMVLRPYQYYAVEEIVKSVEFGAMKNGYIWHTTGSGKTLTSFKASQIISKNKDIDKVVFVVDRKDLDFNTMKEFDSFSKGSVDSTDNTDQLISHLIDTKTSILITTMQKLNNAVSKAKHLNQMEVARDKRIVFIFDECHRSQFGESHGRIDEFFTNKQFFGFTGTPIFVENANKGKTTEMLFGKRLHSYIIKDAIADDNVLGFSVEYLSTFRGKNDRLFDAETGKDKTYYDMQVEGIDTKEVFYSDDRIDLVVDYILNIHSQKTKQKEFTAMFAVSSVPTLIKYYEAFKQQEHDLKIATIFSYKSNDDLTDDGTFSVEEPTDKNVHPREKIDEFVKDYNNMFGENHNLNKHGGYNAYYIDVSKKVKERKIDILLVVNMFLTGFDSKRLNTLYTDKNLTYHGLIQAYSRTNRILNDKKRYGNIVNFRNIYDKTNEAIRLFSDEDALGTVLMKTYGEYIVEANNAITMLLEKVPNPNDPINETSEEELLLFIKLFRNVVRKINQLDTFTEFDYSDLKLTEELFAEYRNSYYDAYERTKKDRRERVSILNDIDFEIDLLRKDKINVDYIINLLSELDSKNPNFEKEVNFILSQMDSSDRLRSKKELVKEFILSTNFVPGGEIDEKFYKFLQERKEEELKQYVFENNLDEMVVKEVISEYEYSEKIDKNDVKKSINTLVKGKDYKDGETIFQSRKNKVEYIMETLTTFVQKYTW